MAVLVRIASAIVGWHRGWKSAPNAVAVSEWERGGDHDAYSDDYYSAWDRTGNAGISMRRPSGTSVLDAGDRLSKCLRNVGRH
jgi:hypothetical protein